MKIEQVIEGIMEESRDANLNVARECRARLSNSFDEIFENVDSAIEKSCDKFAESIYLIRKKLETTLEFNEYQFGKKKITGYEYNAVRTLCHELKGILDGAEL